MKIVGFELNELLGGLIGFFALHHQPKLTFLMETSLPIVKPLLQVSVPVPKVPTLIVSSPPKLVSFENVVVAASVTDDKKVDFPLNVVFPPMLIGTAKLTVEV